MKLLDRQVWSELSGPFLFGIAAFTSIFFAGGPLQKITNYMLRGLPAITAVEVALLALPGIVVLTLPMSTLLAILQGFGRLSSDSEIVALYSSGVSLKRLAAPVVVLGVAVALVSFTLNEVVVPVSNRLRNEIVQQALKEPLKRKQALSFVETDGDMTTQVLVFGGISVREGVMRDVTVTQYKGRNPVIIFNAKRAVRNKEEGDRWTLHEGHATTLTSESTNEIGFRRLETQEIKLERTPEEIALEGMEPDEMSTAQLVSLIRAKKPIGADTANLEVGLYNKFALPFASLVFATIALPLGIRPHRSGASYGMGLSVLVILAYWLIWHYMTALAAQGGVAPMFGAFLADLIGLAAGAALIARSPN